MDDEQASEPFVRDGTEWVAVSVHGQSFILHQIRKMMGMTILLMRSGVPLTLMDQMYHRVKVNIPKAPSLGLLLKEPVYGRYNDRCDRMADTSQSFVGEKISFAAHHEQIREFKERWIYSEIHKVEADTHAYVPEKEDGDGEEENSSHLVSLHRSLDRSIPFHRTIPHPPLDRFYGWWNSIRSHGSSFAFLFAKGELPPVFRELALLGINDPKRVPAPKKTRGKVKPHLQRHRPKK